jgi:uncharacterized protein
MYQIVCFDGGGIRGVYTAVLLDRLVQSLPKLLNNVDLLAGTSTGGIIALGLASGMTTTQLIQLYQNKGAQIFNAPLLHKIRDLGEIVGAKYSNADLVQIISDQFGEKTLDQLLPQHVLIPSFDLDKPQGAPRMWYPKFFHNFAGPDSDGAQKVADVALRTSAAPTYFPSYQGFVDGGVVANNPSMSALAQALDPRSNTGIALSDIRLFSLGTGVTPTFISGLDNNWGLAQWARVLADMMLEGMMGVADFECACLLGANRYFRLAPVLPNPIPLDAASQINNLIADAQNVDISAAVVWLKANF